MKSTIYLLSKNGVPYFVGHTKNPELREFQIKNSNKCVNTIISFDVLEKCADKDLRSFRNCWIRQLAAKGYPIENKGKYPSNWIWHRTAAKDVPVELLHEVCFAVNRI